MPSPKTRVLNPDGSFGITSAKQANRYVRRGRAAWMPDGSIRFFSDHHQCAAATLSREQMEERARKIGYDQNVSGDGCNRNELRGIPFVGDIDRLVYRRA